MADLLLRRGTLANLNGTTPVDGAINIVTDERAIYIDVKNGGSVERRRIGDFVMVDTWQELMANKEEGTPNTTNGKFRPWSATALYYVVNENALLKWNATTEKWVQINTSSELESIVNNLQTNITQVQESLGTLTSDHNALKDRVEKAEKAITDEETARKATDAKVSQIEKDYKAEDEKLKGLIDAITGGVDGGIDLTGLQSQITQNADDIKANQQAIANNKAAIDKLNGDKNVEGSVDNKIDKAIQASEAKTNDEIAKQVGAETSARNKAIDDLKNELEKADNDLKSELTDLINSELEAADAMTFKGVIGTGDGATYNNLPTTGVNAGDTYKVGTAGKYGSSKTGDSGIYSPGQGTGEGQQAYVGDLFIALEDQGDAVNYTGTWAYVESGYAESYDPTLVIDNINKSIELRNTVGANRGKASFKAAENSNLKVEVVNDSSTNNIPTFTFGLVWQSFNGETE